MKKIIMILAGILLFAACNKSKEVDIKYQLTANINVLDVVNSIKDIDNSDLFVSGKIPSGEKVRVSFFIYNNRGELVSEETNLLNSFAENIKITNSLKEGDYTLICIADLVEVNSSNTITFKYWELGEHTSLQDFKINFPNTDIGISMVLGSTKQAISITRSEIKTINIEPVGSMVTLDFDYLNISNIQTIKLYVNTWNNYFSVSDGRSNLIELLNNGNIYSLQKGDYRNKIQSLYYLPTNKISIKWLGLDISGKQVASGVIPTSALTASKNKLYTINTSTGQIVQSLKGVATVSQDQSTKQSIILRKE